MQKLDKAKKKKLISLFFACAATFSACSSESEPSSSESSDSQNNDSEPSANQDSPSGETVDASFPFADGALAEDITSGECELSNGDISTCYTVTVTGISATNDIGPFCPPTIESSAEDGGIWVDGDKFYEIDGSFIEGLAETYNDDNWQLYDDEGNVNITDTQEAFEGAAKPDVEEEYQNHCVEGKIEWTAEGGPVPATIVVPADPQSTAEVTFLNTNPGVTLDGVIIDPPAPVDAILGAYTIAAFDDCGGHVNPGTGYHIHAATDCAATGEAADGETPPFALAIDGHLIHVPYSDGEAPDDLDDCNGHESEEFGYHYHANAPETNQVLSCVTGLVSADVAADAGGGPGGGGRGGPPPQAE